VVFSLAYMSSAGPMRACCGPQAGHGPAPPRRRAGRSTASGRDPRQVQQLVHCSACA